ncbi:MAG TPA: FtsX-like permease family protein, partial [Acidimicrobiales bacterium]
MTDVDGDLHRLDPGSIAVHRRVAEDGDVALGDRVEVRFGTGAVTELEVVAIYETVQAGWDLWVVPEVFTREVPGYGGDTEIWVATAGGVPAERAEAAIGSVLAAHPDARVTFADDAAEAAGDWEWQVAEVDRALLAVLVVVALIGTASGVVLATIERRRELALLRAVGASIRQVALLLAGELLLAGTLGGLVGAVAGAGTSRLAAARSADVVTPVTPYAAIAATLAVALTLVAVASLLPALWLTRRPVAATLSEGAPSWRGAGYDGLVLVLDEVETLQRVR